MEGRLEKFNVIARALRYGQDDFIAAN